MASHSESPQDIALSFDVDEVPFRLLLKAGQAFSNLLREVARAYIGTARDPAQWLVHVEAGSVVLPLRGEASGDLASNSQVYEVGVFVAQGLALIEGDAVRPDHFTDRALEQARELAKLASGGDLSIEVRGGGVRSSLTSRLIVNVDTILGHEESSTGTIEGALEAFNVHGKNKRFNVYDSLTGRSVECKFTDDVTVDDLRPAIGRRVAVRGLVRARPDGRPVSVDARELEVFPPEHELPTPDEVFGLLRGYAREDE